MLRQREDMEARLAKIRAKEKAQREKYLKGDENFKRRKMAAEKDKDDEERFVLEEYESDLEQSSHKKGIAATRFSAATLELLGQLGMGTTITDEQEDEMEDEIKVSHHMFQRT